MKKDIKKLFLKYTIPGVIGMIVTSLYIVVDGIFIGKAVGSDGLAAVSMVGPLTSLSFALNIMIATGSATIVAIKMGEKKIEEASKIFSFFVLMLILGAGGISLFTLVFPDQTAVFLGATGDLKSMVIEYMKIIMYFNIFYMGTYFLEIFVRTNGRPTYSMSALIIGGILNIILDYIWVIQMGYGLKGAAFATGISQTVASIILIIDFFRSDSQLKFVKPDFSLNLLLRGIINGSSEFVSEISLGFIIFMFNLIIMREVGKVGVSAFSIINYVNTVVFAILLGVSQGIQPIISYSLGADERYVIRGIFNLAIKTVFIIGTVAFTSMFIFSEEIIGTFSKNKELLTFTTKAAKIYCFAYFLNGINMVMSAYFTAIENAALSAFISALRGIIFVLMGTVIFPLIWGIDGIWFTMPVAEVLTAFIGYRYIKKCKVLDLKAA
ncbi:MATE family efflux transporter [Fusobacteria bacterium ZRK30]|nr:MATE family efflux transporter [Fusobacteria bacterium ZRK30]